jgi:deazaflavin-dependent oxidoreductase (nitroreductase family)
MERKRPILAGSELFPYPAGLGRLMLKLPLALYRLGIGDVVNAAHIMVLVTRGRKSGQPRYTPIEYRRHGSKTYLVSAWGERPQWYQNLLAEPTVTVQQGRHVFSACASRVTNSGEALRVMHLFRRRAPVVYDALLARASEGTPINPRTLPDLTHQLVMVRLDPRPNSSELPELPVDYGWVMPFALIAGLGVTVLLALVRPREKT